MSDEERRQWIRIVVDQAAGRIPVAATTTSGHRIPAVQLSRYAQDVGADGIMSMPPHILHPDADGCYEYYASLSEALTIPICIQNYIGPIGTPMSNEFVARLCRELPAADETCKGVFGGQGGVYMIDEWRRGACGNMPAAQITDLHVDNLLIAPICFDSLHCAFTRSISASSTALGTMTAADRGST